VGQINNAFPLFLGFRSDLFFWSILNNTM
jgi:hypothetical protein